MKTLRRKARVILSTLICIVFFLPAYNGVSGFRFVSLAFSEVATNRELTQTDVLILVVPLVLVPLTALAIALISWLRISLQKIYTAMPLLCFLSFMAILLMSAGNGSSSFSKGTILSQMGLGFYLTLLAAAYLPFTKNPVVKKIRRRRSVQLESAV